MPSWRRGQGQSNKSVAAPFGFRSLGRAEAAASLYGTAEAVPLSKTGLFPQPVFGDIALALMEEANACDAGGSGVEAGGGVFEGDATEGVDGDG